MNSKLFGEKISALRKAKGLTQAQLAESLNVSNKTISRWETGEGYP
ncbi:MAG: helix-turn-helix transcriptional regulator, partial [Firmicutes bacterium]|nr:helix-turn-helix transcriptional regulator [Bacillota bacterium]